MVREDEHRIDGGKIGEVDPRDGIGGEVGRRLDAIGKVYGQVHRETDAIGPRERNTIGEDRRGRRQVRREHGGAELTRVSSRDGGGGRDILAGEIAGAVRESEYGVAAAIRGEAQVTEIQFTADGKRAWAGEEIERVIATGNAVKSTKHHCRRAHPERVRDDGIILKVIRSHIGIAIRLFVVPPHNAIPT
jgi:hypothetical protein